MKRRRRKRRADPKSLSARWGFGKDYLKKNPRPVKSADSALQYEKPNEIAGLLWRNTRARREGNCATISRCTLHHRLRLALGQRHFVAEGAEVVFFLQ